jgi:hypothetical protein
MNHHLSNARRGLRARRAAHQWSRLERDLTSGHRPDAHNGEPGGEMRRYLAAQASQTV